MNVARAQSPGSTFTLEGTINTDTGTIKLVPFDDGIYYSGHRLSIISPLEKGKFLFRDSISYPLAYMIFLYKGAEIIYISHFFIVEPGFQSIRCNVDSLREIPQLINNSMKELMWYYNEVLHSINGQIYQLEEKQDGIRNIYGKNLPDSLQLNYENDYNRLQLEKKGRLLTYIKEHPDSYAALWDLIHSLESGYASILDSEYTQFSDSIKNTFTGRVLGQKLNGARVIALGGVFPRLQLLTVRKSPAMVPLLEKADKYIFVDFWFSHCSACISEFPELKNIFASFHQKGFDIVGISTDGEKQVDAWKEAIQINQLPWNQYLDLGGKEAQKLAIQLFPTNFLLDDHGRIIGNNMEPSQLKAFLKQKLH